MYVIGADIGTSGAKAMLMDEKGRALALAGASYPIHAPRDGWAEQDAEDWYAALVETVRKILPPDPENVTALALSTQAGTTVPVDESGSPLRRAITWMDERAQAQVAAFRAAKSDEDWHRETGVVPEACYSMAHIAYLRDEEPEIFQKAARFLTTPDFLAQRLAGRAVIDPTNASMTDMLDLPNARWHEGGMAAAGIGADRLAEMRPTGSLVGNLTAGAARDLGLTANTRLYNGLHDQYAAATGCGAVEPGDFMMSCGTAWVLLGAFDRFVSDSMLLTPGRHTLPGVYGAFYSIPVGSASLDWMLGAAGLSKADLPEVNRVCAERVLQNGQLLFYPYLNGATKASDDMRARAVFAGLSLSHDRYDMLLSVMEGIAFEVRRAIAIFEQAGCPVKQLTMLGGASKSDLWANILAAVTGRAVIRGAQSEAACVGAAYLAGAGCGLFEGVRVPRADATVCEPDPALRAHYEAKFARYAANLPAALQIGRKTV